MTGSKEQKTTHLFPSKYAKTYIHREHAILHTLEIERSQLSENNHEHSSLIYISDTEQPDAEFENMFDKLSGLESFSVSPPEHRPYILVNDSEDDRSKKHMRGLKDIGTGGELKPCVKRRRSQVAYGHDCVKKRNRSYQPTNALKRTETVMEPDTREIYRNLSGVSGVEYNDAKQSLSNSSGDSCVWLFDVPYTGCEPNLTAGLVTVNETAQAVGGPQSGQSSLVETVSGGPDEIQEFGSISSGNGTSEWQHRGKRNLRVNTKNAQKVLYPEVKFKSDPIMDTVTAPQKLIPYCQSRFTVNPKYQSCVSYTDNDTISLYDVDIEVQAAQLPQDAPYISLMSKSSRHRTTGHALLVEVLDDSESDLSLIGSESISSSYELNGVDSKKLEIQNLSSITCLKNPNEASKVVKLGRGKHLRDKTRKRKALTGLERQNESGQHDDISTGLERQSESGQQDDISTYSSITHANPSLSSHEQEHLIKCPRCNSSNTKFVYYNNYNLSQPRHYCKRCRRFWTIGGALRNLRVGGGFRKTSKHASKSKRGVSSSANSDFIKTKFRSFEIPVIVKIKVFGHVNICSCHI